MATFSAQAIIFDLDGVLVDSTACVERYWKLWAEEHNLDAQEILKMSHGRPTLETMRLVAPHLPVEAEAQKLDRRQAVDTDGVVAVEGAIPLIASLPEGCWAVCTSGDNAIATTRLRHVGLPIPAIFVTVEQISRGKPHPEGYLLAASRLGIAPQDCIVLEDAPPGIEAAKAAGMRVIGVGTTYPAEVLSMADAFVPSLAALQLTINFDGDNLSSLVLATR